MSKSTTDNNYDAIVIGSGLGGLTAAAILSRHNKQRVLVLERHHEIGGLTHEFRRGPFSWDVGLHYVGNSVKEQLGLNIFSYITDDKIKWNSMDDPFEKFVFPDITVDVPSSQQAYKQTLHKLFPAEIKAINRYFKDVERAASWFRFNYLSSFNNTALSWILNGFKTGSKSLGLMITQDYLDKNIKDTQLRGILSSRFGDYGLPPLESAFCIHAVLEAHYAKGGLFPDGGSEKIALYCEQVIEHFGGKILINREVTKILVDNQKATGVEVKDVNAPDKQFEVISANTIISDTGAWSTFNKLLPKTLNLDIQKKLANFIPGYSAVSLFLGLKESPQKLGLTSANQWIYDDYDLNKIIKGYGEGHDKNARGLFLSFPSMKSNKGGLHTAEIITFVPHDLFSKWKDQPWKQRSNDYYELKDEITTALLNLVEKHIPKFREIVSFHELATPLTLEHFTGRVNGSLYGIPMTPDRLRLDELRAKTPVANLYLTGSDACTLGIMGTLLGGIAAASSINGPFGMFKIMKSAITARKKQTHLSTGDSTTFPENQTKVKAVIVENRTIKQQIRSIVFEVPKPVNLKPGQHVKIMVANEEWRSYTIEKSENKLISLLVDTKHGGPGGKFFSTTKPGATMVVRIPLTDFILTGTDRSIVLFASSVGITAAISILQRLQDVGFKHKIRIFFGAVSDKDLFVDSLIKEYCDSLDLEITYCVDNIDTAAAKPLFFHGTVTKAFKESNLIANEHDNYICGNPFMVQATVKMLRSQNAAQIFW